MKEYVCGFLFSPDFEYVALIKKTHPEWQAGKLNGIGGHIEPGESAIDAMCREFNEETGVELGPHKWVAFCRHEWNTPARVTFFVAVDEIVFSLNSPTDEEVIVFQVEAVPYGNNTISNIPWLIRMAIECFTRGTSYAVSEVVYTYD